MRYARERAREGAAYCVSHLHERAAALQLCQELLIAGMQGFNEASGSRVSQGRNAKAQGLKGLWTREKRHVL